MIRFLPNFAVFCVFLWISQDFTDLPEFRGSTTARNIRSPVYIAFLAFTTFDLVNNLVGILYIIFHVSLYTVVVFLVKGKIKWMNEWMNEWKNHRNKKPHGWKCKGGKVALQFKDFVDLFWFLLLQFYSSLKAWTRTPRKDKEEGRTSNGICLLQQRALKKLQY